jgi:hypothetical protein
MANAVTFCASPYPGLVEIDNATLEMLAMKIHETYLSVQTRDRAVRGSTSALPPWGALENDLKEANRAQARDITAKLARIGCTVRPGLDKIGFAFTTEELERLARDEHQRWVRQRRATGWVHGPVRDNERKHHPEITSWRQLSDEARDKDRDAIRNLPEVLAAAGLHIERQ